MFNETFIFLPGVQEKTEQRLWQQGIGTWDHLLEAKHIPFVSAERLSFWKGRLRSAQQQLQQGELHTLSRQLGSRYAWRAFAHIMDNPRYIDIETTEYRNQITVIGISDGDFSQAFVKGRNLDFASLQHALADATCIITFNGSSFDLPIIERNFPGLLPNVPHIDLRHVCSQAGLHGGLKRIEQHLGIARPSALRDVNGADAIMLWYRHLFGDEGALQELVDYNAADVLNLQPIAQLVIPALWEHIRYGREFPFAQLPRTVRQWGV